MDTTDWADGYGVIRSGGGAEFRLDPDAVRRTAGCAAGCNAAVALGLGVFVLSMAVWLSCAGAIALNVPFGAWPHLVLAAALGGPVVAWAGRYAASRARRHYHRVLAEGRLALAVGADRSVTHGGSVLVAPGVATGVLLRATEGRDSDGDAVTYYRVVVALGAAPAVPVPVVGFTGFWDERTSDREVAVRFAARLAEALGVPGPPPAG